MSERRPSRGSATIGILLIVAGLAFGAGAVAVSRAGGDAPAPVSRGSLSEIEGPTPGPGTDRSEARNRPDDRRRPPRAEGQARQDRSRNADRRRAPRPDRSARPERPVRPEPVLAPTGLAIPSLGVLAPVLPVGIDEKGELAVPDPVDQLGWYRFGPAPGSAGSAVIAGHVDGRGQGPGALFRARELQPGQEIISTDAQGGSRRFTVVAVRQYTKGSLPPEVWSRTGEPRLTLVTCGGDFANGHYRDNVVVYAAQA